MPSTAAPAGQASGNGVRSVLIAAVAVLACARTPVTRVEPVEPVEPASSVEPVPDDATLKAAKEKDRCVDALPANPRRDSPDDDIVQVSLAADRALGRTESGRIRVWNMHGSAVSILPRAPFRSLSADGSTGVTVDPLPPGGARLEAWDLASDRRLAATDLKYGLAGYGGSGTLVATSRLVLARVGGPECDDECREFEGGPPLSELVTWDLASGKVESSLLGQQCGPQAAVSSDGARSACVSEDGDFVSWHDMQRFRSGSFRPAPEWRQPLRIDRRDEEPQTPNFTVYVPPTVRIGSLRLSPGGDEVTVAYRGLGLVAAMQRRPEHHGWRLERWTPDVAGNGPGKIERLATAPVSFCARLLAASADGHLLVFGGHGYRLTVRRAPRYEAEPFAGDVVALAAAVSTDGARILTGHADGRLRLWDAGTLRLSMTSD